MKLQHGSYARARASILLFLQYSQYTEQLTRGASQLVKTLESVMGAKFA